MEGSNWVAPCWVLDFGSRVKPVSSYSGQLVVWTTQLEGDANWLMGRCLFDDNTIACFTTFTPLTKPKLCARVNFIRFYRSVTSTTIPPFGK